MINFSFILLFLLNIISILSEKPPKNPKSLTKRRILSEYRDIIKDNLTLQTPFNTTSLDDCEIRLSPIENNFLEWHFSFTGMKSSNFEGGVYHGRILLPPDYPRKAPSICIYTPNGRWEVGKDICLSASSYHQETWDLNWNLRTLVLGLRGHMITQPREIGGITTTPERQRILATLSQSYYCKQCDTLHAELLNHLPMSRKIAKTNTNIHKTKKKSTLPTTASTAPTNTNSIHKRHITSKPPKINNNVFSFVLSKRILLICLTPLLFFLIQQYMHINV